MDLHPYHLDKSTFILRDIRSNFHFSMKFQANRSRIAPDETPRFAASHLGLICLPMSHKKDSRFIWANQATLKLDYVFSWSTCWQY